ncbi:hypothetical protein [Thioalkalivibrio sp. ALE16]|uniref:hypothetical protein n=1 Tax=Thioalkalivibrio sp. ALE16 TaxID=1158172 RepID=UPI00035E39F9|nr:hypothetical protein [Thioalkalivibrio sp. ALE16]
MDMVSSLKLTSTLSRWVRDFRALPHGLLRILAVVFAIVSGLAFFSAGWVIAAPDQGRVVTLEQSLDVAAPLCEQHAARMGFHAAPEGTQMLLTHPGGPVEPLVPLFEATLQGCRGYQLESLCIGEGCAASPNLTLRYAP